MPTARLFPGLLLVLALSAPVASQGPPTPGLATPAVRPPEVRYVAVPEVEVRCAPSMQMYPTNVLHRGDKVEVVVEGTGGWLAIRPPEGSFSWINTRLLQPVAANQPVHVVAQEGQVADVITGSSLRRDRPDVVGTKLQRGAQVRAIGPGLTDRDGTWLPIEPPPGEVRYIAADAVAKTPPAAAPAVAGGPAGPSTFTAAAVPAAPPAPPNPDSLWRQAAQAERSGQIAEAIRLYVQAGTANVHLNPARSMEAFDRARELDQRSRAAIPPGGYAPAANPPLAGPPSEVRYTVSPDRPAPAAADPNTPTVRLAPPNPMNPPTYGPAYPVPAGQAPYAPANASAGRGWLRRSGRTIESQRTYVLDDTRGLPLYYVTAGPGLALDAFVNRYVDLYGPVVYDGEIRANHMTATRVQMAQ